MTTISQSDNVTAYEHEEDRHIILQPGNYPARTGSSYGFICTPEDILPVLEDCYASDIVALDFETSGADYTAPGFYIAGLGLAWDNGNCYIPWNILDTKLLDACLQFLKTHKGLIAHNVYFDGGVIKRLYNFHPAWKACTYSMLALLHNESVESRWGLKDVMVNFLGWEQSNELELDQWLCDNGHGKIDSKGKLYPKKGMMCLAPPEILGKYCMLDTEACFLLYHEILLPPAQYFSKFLEFFGRDIMHLIEIHIDQKIHGIQMDRAAIDKLGMQLLKEADDCTSRFLAHKDIRPHVEAYEKAQLKQLLSEEPTKYKLAKTLKPATAAKLKNPWVKLADAPKGKIVIQEESAHWIRFQKKLAVALRGELPDVRFNVNSHPQLCKLFYEDLKYPVEILTEGGEPATSGKALSKFGEPGKILMARADAVKSLSFINRYLELMDEHKRSTLHPSFRLPGTITGRLSSNNINVQQIPKTKDMLSLFVSRPGHVFVDLDFQSLEPTVTTEFSKDKNMEMIYGNTASPYQDFYLFIASSIPGIQDRVRRAGYDPLNPTKEGVANAKKECKADRNVCKSTALGCAYGAGIKKVHQTLEEQGVYLSMDQVATIHTGYWNLFAGVKDYGKSLYFEWKRNKGYIMNGTGRPMSVPEAYNKDLLNRMCQSTGHDCLIKYIRILCNELRQARVPFHPIIMDIHDATTIEVEEKYSQKAVECFNIAMKKLNDELKFSIKLKGTAVIGRNLAEAKEITE